MKTSDTICEISKAISIAQGEMKPASKSTVNPFFKSKYSTLAQIWDVIREPMAKNGLSVFQDVSSRDGVISITTRVSHASGQWIEFGPLDIPVIKRDAQAVGSAISYGKRYALSAALGVVSEEEDDDAESAIRECKAALHVERKPINNFNRDQALKDLNLVLIDCGEEYELKIFSHFGIEMISDLKNDDLKMVLKKALAFREQRMKNNV